MKTYELFYSSGGHGGPYATLDFAQADAVRLLAGRKGEHSIAIHERGTGEYFVGGYAKHPIHTIYKHSIHCHRTDCPSEVCK